MHKHGLKALGLTLMAAIGLMALNTTAALAAEAPILNLGDKFYENNETPAEFLTNSGTLTPTALATRAVAGKQIGSSRMGVPGKSAEIVCAKGEGTGTAANEYHNYITNTMATGAHGHFTLKFKECKTEEINPATHALTAKTLTNCVPNGTGEIVAHVLHLGKKHREPAGGTAKTHLVVVPLVSTEGEAKANEALTSSFTLTLTFGELCALPPSVKVTGSASFLTPTADAVKPVLKVDTLPKAEQELMGTKLKFGFNEAFVQAEWEFELPANPGVPWGLM